MPVHPDCVATNFHISSIDTRSACIAMSAATTAARVETAYLISKHTDLTGIVRRNPSWTTSSLGLSLSALTWIPGCDLTSSPAVTRTTGSGVCPSGARPVIHWAPIQRSAAQPVTPPYDGNTAAASTIRCSGVLPSTSDGT